MTSQQLTDSTDLDYYIDEAEPTVISDWQSIDEQLFRKARKPITTDANGVAILDFKFTFLLRMENTDRSKYPLIDDADSLRHSTGYFFQGTDDTTKSRQVLIYKDGSPQANATLYVFTDEDVYTGTAADALPALPHAYADLIPMKACELYFRDQGGPFIGIADEKGRNYSQRIAQAASQYKQLTDDPMYMSNDSDPDAGEFYSSGLI